MRFIEDDEEPEVPPATAPLAIQDQPAPAPPTTKDAPDDLHQQKDKEKEDAQTNGTERKDKANDTKTAEKENPAHDAKSADKKEPKKDTTDLKHGDGPGGTSASASGQDAKRIRAEIIRPGGRQTSDHL